MNPPHYYKLLHKTGYKTVPSQQSAYWGLHTKTCFVAVYTDDFDNFLLG
jgi:hypothetical protein